MDKFESYKRTVKNAFLNAENSISKVTDQIINMEGMTGRKTRHFYNNLVQMEDARYLEIGTWKGSSVCSAMCGNSATVVCIDNWSEYGGPKDEFLVNFTNFKGNNNANFIEQDCFKVDVSTLPNFNIYMFDGEHSENSQYLALKHYYQCLDNIFIFIVDDWNEKCVRDGTMRAIEELNLDILYEKEIHTPANCTFEGWWNGIFVCICKKNIPIRKITDIMKSNFTK